MKLLKIGRDASCDIVLYSEKVSSLHAEITLLNSGDILLEDKGSSNGTFVMNQPVKPNKPINIRRGDAVRFADVELQWSQVPMPEDNSAYKGVYGIGSNFNNDIQISGATVSRYHATVKQGKDGKMYIIDHSKNGTTVDGVKIPKDSLYRIKKNSAVVCGGVPVDLSRLPWGSSMGKTLLGIAAGLVVLIGLCAGGFFLWNNRGSDAEKIYKDHNNAMVMLVGMYHYEVTAGDLPLEKMNLLTKFLFVNGQPVSMEGMPSDTIYKYGGYTGTGFLISDDGQIVTNLHLVKPWLFNDALQQIESWYKREFAKISEDATASAAAEKTIMQILGVQGGNSGSGMSAYISQIKVKGVCDGVLLVPQGSYLSDENTIKCRVLSAGEDINKDVALIQSDKKDLPSKHSTFIDMTKNLDPAEEALTVGRKVFMLGFPYGMGIQDMKSEKGIMAFCHEGKISQASGDFSFNFDATSASGASGSPIFNEKGKVIGIMSQRIPNQNFNTGVKALYIKELLESPHTK